jgi:hypothetical protein
VKCYIESTALCGAETLDTVLNRSEIPGEILLNMVLEKYGEVQWNRSCEK